MTEDVKPKRKSGVPRDEHGLTPAERRMHHGMLRICSDVGIVHLSSTKLCKQVGTSVGRWHVMMGALRGARLVQLARAGGPQRTAVYRVFAAPQAEWPELPELPALEAFKPPPRPPASTKPKRAPKAESRSETPTPRTPGRRAVIKIQRHPKTGAVINAWAMGTADQFDIGSADDRISALDEAERRRISEQYGATFKAGCAA